MAGSPHNCVKTIESVSAIILGDKPHLMGTKPCAADATLFAFMAEVLCARLETPLRTIAEAYPNLVEYVARMRASYYPQNLQYPQQAV